MARVRQFIDTEHLSVRSKEVCDFYNRGWRVDEIAEGLGIAVGTVQQHIARARLKNKKRANSEVSELEASAAE